MINILLSGCNGKMGQEITKAVNKYNDLKIVAGVSRSGEQKNAYPVFNSFDKCNVDFDIIIDFSKPDCLHELLDFAKSRNKPILVCTTGFSNEEKEYIVECSKNIPLFFSPNTSIGINVMLEVTKKLSSILGNDFDIEIIEKHHNQKVDAPSGTSLMIAEQVKDNLPNCEYVYDRHALNEKRKKNQIGIHSIRGGTYPGEHSIIFAGNDEILEITHSALSKSIFAEGAIKAAKFMINKPAGLYGMKDIINS